MRDVRDQQCRRRVLASPIVGHGSPQVVLRELVDRDLDVLFEHATDREAIRTAAFTSQDPDDRGAFDARWARLRRDPTTTNGVVEIGGRVVGHIASFELDGQREVTYWIGRQHWGKGIATRALQEFLTRIEAARPLHARAAIDNAGSIRVLENAASRAWETVVRSHTDAKRRRRRSSSDSTHDPRTLPSDPRSRCRRATEEQTQIRLARTVLRFKNRQHP
jgi:RimJ/RimL family protein N-acetyltransferase